MKFNDQTITWDTETFPIKDRDTYTLSSVEALIEVYMSANEPQTLKVECTLDTKILDAEYKHEHSSLDDFIKKSDNLHVKA
jgi:hypothetical protein